MVRKQSRKRKSFEEDDLTEKDLSARYRAETQKILSQAKLLEAQAKHYERKSNERAKLAKLRAKRISTYEDNDWEDIPTAEDIADAYEKTAKSITYKTAGLYLLGYLLATPVGLVIFAIGLPLLTGGALGIGTGIVLWIGIIIWSLIALVNVHAKAPKEMLKNMKRK